MYGHLRPALLGRLRRVDLKRIKRGVIVLYDVRSGLGIDQAARRTQSQKCKS